MARPKKKVTPATWQVGKFTASKEDDYYTLRAGKSLMIRTKSEEQFKEYCALIEVSA